MGNDFNRVLILADYGSLNLAQRVHSILSKKEMHGGLAPFYKDGLYINLFNNGEIDINIKSSIRGRNVFLLKSFDTFSERWDKDNNAVPKPEELCANPNQGYMELFLLNDALKRAEAKEITNVLEFMPYLRQDRRPRRKGNFTRSPISAKAVVDIIQAKADRLITLDPHFKQFEAVAESGIDCLDSFVLFVEDINRNYREISDKIVFVAPDLSSAEIAQRYAKFYNTPTAIINKKRDEEGKSEVINVISDLKDFNGRYAILVDDIIDTGGTIVKAAKALKAKGVKKFTAYCTHAVLSLDAKDKLLQEDIGLVTTEGILIPNLANYPNIRILDTSYLVAGAIDCICNGHSISQKLEHYQQYKKDKDALS